MAATERRALIVTDRFLDLVEMLSAAGMVHRVGMSIGDPEAVAARAKVTNGTPGGTDYGLVVRMVGALGAVDITDNAARVLGIVSVSGSVAVTGPLTDAQMRATPIGVDVTDEDARLLGRAKILNGAGAVIDPLTDTQLRATPVPVSGTIATTGPLTDAQLRATPVPGDLRRGQTVLFAVIDAALSGDNTIVAADGTKKIKVLSYAMVADAAVVARWKSGAAGNLSGAMSIAATGGIASPVATPGGGHLLETAVNQALVLNLGAAIGVRGHCSYFLEA